MERRQRIFLFIVTTLVVIFAAVLMILKNTREQTLPAPVPIPTLDRTVPPQPPTQTPEAVETTPAPSGEARQTPTIDEQQVFYVAPDGKEENDGSEDHPWPLQYALDHPNDIMPGATIWLKEGEYTGPFTSLLQGEEGRPITVRAIPGQRAVLSSDELVIDIATSQYVNFWGLEIKPIENPRNPDLREDLRGSYGVRINQSKDSHHIKFINMIVHDMPAQGFGWWQANRDSEIYGSLIFFNGITQFEHGIYLHNTDGEKRIVDNIIFDNASHGIHAYGEKDYQKLNNITLEGNTVFNNGSIGFITNQGRYGVFKRNILVGGSSHEANNPVIRDNYTYFPGTVGEAFNLGYKAGSDHAVVENNYFAGGQVKLGGRNSDLMMDKNTIMGTGLFGGFNLASANNVMLQIKPVNSELFVRPNQHEPGRANITIYNWTLQDIVTLDAEDLERIDIKEGDRYELRNVQDYFEDVIEGTYDGSNIAVPMNNHTVAQPMGLSFKPPSTFPEFGVFVLLVTPGQ